MHIAVIRMDNIGDAILTFPMLGAIKMMHPDYTISFIGSLYVKPVLGITSNIDNFIDLDSLKNKKETDAIKYIQELNIDCLIHLNSNKFFARLICMSGIGVRVGTTRRSYNWLYCNSLVHFIDPNRSTEHIVDRNMKFLKPLGMYNKDACFNKMKLSNIVYDFYKDNADLNRKTKVVIHPGSNEHGAEWGQDNYFNLVSLYSSSNDVEFYLTGVSGEKKRFGALIDKLQCVSNCHDMMGAYTLEEMISFLSAADVVISSSTGIAHLASILGIQTITLFPSKSKSHGWSITSKQWKPIGTNSTVIEPIYDKNNYRVGPSDMDLIVEEDVRSVLNKIINKQVL